ncbi:hypothetical protein DEJ49_33065 [Streptomyces venezuelae]|uniref:Protein kilB n=1 Tax=Streptomyces venezuelae TaxID=54571 RepID=A0A5P2CQJ5_STRVZ|nr:hypothetical protein [Streptomyces venezuelae]QES45174.1 hypothetical protein DEJ49_33065 [Streptomyces venezuelae]
MESAIVLVAGTLLGGLLQYLITDWRARSERRREALADAAGALLGSLAALRQEQYEKIVARRQGVADSLDDMRTRYAARTAVTTARGALRLATRDAAVVATARQAIGATFALGDAPDDADLQTVGDAARDAHDAFEDAAVAAVHARR